MNEEREVMETTGENAPAAPENEDAGLTRAELADWYVPGGADAPAGDEAADAPAAETARRKKRRRVRGITVGVCVLLLIAAAGFALWRTLGRVRIRVVTETAGLPPAMTAPGLPAGDGESFDDYRDYFASFYANSDEVSIGRAPLGTGVAVTLYPPVGQALSLQEIYDAVSPAVVGVTALRDGQDYSWGTGVVFTEDGYIITNTHILSGSDSVIVRFMNGLEFDALLVGSDSASDIAVLKMEGHGFPCAVFGDSDRLRVGDTVAAIGDPLGEAYAGTMTDGIISAINRDVANNGHTMTLLQTNAALNEGNSGGPLVNAWGQVIGITNMKIMSTFAYPVEGIGFAIPSQVVKEVADQLIAQGYVAGKPSIGITAGAVGAEARALYDLPAGVYVATVEEGSDAAAQGLQVGDIITQVQGQEVRSVADVNAIKDGMAVGDIMTLTVYREGETFQMEIRLVDQAALDARSQPAAGGASH